MKPNYFRLSVIALMCVTGITLAAAYSFICAYVYLEPTLPTVAAMKNNELSVPLRVYTSSGDLIAQIGEQRRNPVKYDQIPLIVREAFVAAEDDRFFEHHGFDWQGVLRARYALCIVTAVDSHTHRKVGTQSFRSKGSGLRQRGCRPEGHFGLIRKLLSSSQCSQRPEIAASTRVAARGNIPGNPPVS